MPYVHVNGFQGESLKANIQWYRGGVRGGGGHLFDIVAKGMGT